MIWLLGGYMWLFIHRPFEVWPWLGALHVERVYMMVTIVYWALTVEKRWIPNRLNTAFIVFWCVVVASCLLSPFNSDIEDYFKVAVFYVLVITSVREEKDLKRLVVIYLAAVGLYMTHSLREFFYGQVKYDQGTWRMMGVDHTYADPNTFAATLVYSLPMILPFLSELRRPWRRWLVVGYVSLSAACIFLTGSRSGFVGLCAFAVVVALTSKHRVKLTALLLIAAPILWGHLRADLQNRFLTLWDPSYGPRNAQTSAEGRMQGWRDGVKLWRQHPLLGVGPGAFGAGRGYNLQAHHLYGQVLGELGTVGAIAFGGVLLAFLANARFVWKLCRNDPTRKTEFSVQLNWAVMLAVGLMLLLGFGGHNLYRYTWLWFGVFQAIAVHRLRTDEARIGPHMEDARSVGGFWESDQFHETLS